jgi:hypothetical protein
MPRPYPALHSHNIWPHHIGPIFMGGALLAILLALLLPTAAGAGDRDSYYGRPAYYYEEDGRYTGGSLGYYPNLDDSYHARYDRHGGYRTGRRYGYSRSYERDYNGRDYSCYCGRRAYYRVYNWKGEHEYRQGSRRHSQYSYHYDYDNY